MSSHINIRPYQKSDRLALLDLMKSNVPTYFAESEIEELDLYLENEIEDYFVLEVDQVIQAAGGINYDYPIGKLSWDFVNIQDQGKGFGSLLIKYRLSLMLNNPQITKISVRTSQLAYRFYEKHNFKLIHVVKNYWADGFDLYEMIYQPNELA